MDSVTQILLGATIGQACFRNRLGGKAVVFGGLCGLLPDLDMAVSVSGPWASLVHHRSFSHSLIVLPLLAPLIGWLGYCWGKCKTPYLMWVHLTFWALITHPLLDLCTAYGTQLLYPLNNTRFAIDAVSVIDLFYSIPLLLALLLGVLRQVPSQWGQRAAIIALVLTTGYLAFGYAQSQKAIRLAKAQLAQENFPAIEVRATPTLLNLGLWHILARDSDGNLRVGLLSTWVPQPIRFYVADLPNDPLVLKALESHYGKIFVWFAMRMVSAEVERHNNGTATVYLRDMRYTLLSDLRRAFFTVIARFDRQGNLVEMFPLPRSERDVKLGQELALMWRLLWGMGR